MEDQSLINGLREKRARVAGEMQAAKRKAQELRIRLLHIDACLRMLDEGYTPRSIRSKPLRKPNPAGLKKGDGTRTALAILRDTGERFDSNELARQVLIRLGKEVTPEAVRMLGVTMQANFSRHKKHLIGFDRSTYPGKWYLIER